MGQPVSVPRGGDRRLNALIIGGSDGIGLALTRRLLDDGRFVVGLSRSESPIADERYVHEVVDVRSRDDYVRRLREMWAAHGPFDACIYCAGIGEELDPGSMAGEVAVFEVNLVGAVATAAVAIPEMVGAGRGHFVALSSQADTFVNPGAPSYSASKAGLSSYLHGLALAVRKRGVSVTNVRFGFVATKMAESDQRPFEISPEKAAALVARCLKKRPIRYTYPKRMAALLWFLRWPARIRILRS
jgi:NAD(P)-dependent dehydrogenase (short-subunit alcohol dehydrogenase family)